jgi:hypothetical protein
VSTASRPKRRLFVEGNNDLHVVAQIAMKLHPEEPSWWHKDLIRDAGSDTKALAEFKTAIKNPGHYGIILDADATDGKRVADRWISLSSLGLGLPDGPPSDGWVDEPTKGLRVGVWLMPDNKSEGALESFLTGLVPEGSSWTYAEEVVDVARRDHHADFAERHKAKARLHTWLAWRKEPGRPYGRAIQAGDLDVGRTNLPLRFVDWMARLYR